MGHVTFAFPADLGYRLAKVHVYASLVDKDIVHLEIRILTCSHLISANLEKINENENSICVKELKLMFHV